MRFDIRKSIFAGLFSVHSTISLSRREQVRLIRLRFERYFSHHSPDDGRSISRNVASLNILVYDVINLYLILNTEQPSENILRRIIKKP